MLFQQRHTFTHHGRTFTIEAGAWPDEESAAAAVIDLQIWAMHLDQANATELHAALDQEREALISEVPYDREISPLAAVRDAQRSAVKTGMQGRTADELTPTVTIDAYQVSAT